VFYEKKRDGVRANSQFFFETNITPTKTKKPEHFRAQAFISES
jgi:hypothetical protein